MAKPGNAPVEATVRARVADADPPLPDLLRVGRPEAGRIAMRCPYCGSLDTQVKNFRPTEDASSIRRRRVCPDCGGRFTTFERVQLRELIVVKKSGRRVPFDRDKLMRSVEVALRKRVGRPERVERMVNGIVRQLESQGDGDIPSDRIGELVMEGLKALDDVAYVRFASVYRNFREARDFGAIVGELRAEDGEATSAKPARTRRETRAHDGAGDCVSSTATGAGWRPPSIRRAARLDWPPNPAVGAIVVRDGAIVGRGATAAGRTPARRAVAIAPRGRGRAWRDALRHARTLLASRGLAALRGRDHRGRHRAGRLGASRTRLRVAGSGHARLREAGIGVEVGTGADAGATRPSRPYSPRHRGPSDGDAETRRDGGRLCPGGPPTIRACSSPGGTPIAGCRSCARPTMRSWSAWRPRLPTIPPSPCACRAWIGSRCASCSTRICAFPRARDSRRPRAICPLSSSPDRTRRAKRPRFLPISASASSASGLDARGHVDLRQALAVLCAATSPACSAKAVRASPPG